MKNITFLIFSLALITFSTYGQQIHMFDQTYMDNAIYNPAAVGYNNTYDFSFIRNQRWGDFDGGSSSNLILFDSPLKENNGIGLNFTSNKIGISNSNSVLVNYAQVFKISNSQNIRFGIGLGVLDTRLDFANISAAQADDPLLLQNSENSNTSFNSSFGLYYSLNKFEFGFSVPQIFTSSAEFDDGLNSTSYNYLRHYIGSAKYTFMLMDNNLLLSPIFYGRYVNDIPFQYDLGAVAEFKNSYWAGVTYKSNYAIAANVGFIINDKFKVGYAYEIAISNNKGSNVNQEFFLGISLPSSKTKKSNINLDSIKKSHREELYSKQVIIDSLLKQSSTVMHDTVILDYTVVDTVFITMDKRGISDSTVVGSRVPIKTLVVENSIDEISPLNSNETVQRSYYVIAGAFSERNNAYKAFKDVSRTNFPHVQIFYNKSNSLYYVILEASLSYSKITEVLNLAYQKNYSDAWILKYTPTIYLID